MSEISLFETIHSARAIRHFRPDPVPHELLTKVLEAAIQAPSAGNRQSWLFVVVTDDAQRRSIGDIYRRASAWVREVYLSNSRPAHMTEAQYRKLWAGGVYQHEHMGDAPVLLLPCLRVTPRILPQSIRAEVRAEMESTGPMGGRRFHLSCRAKHHPSRPRARSGNSACHQSRGPRGGGQAHARTSAGCPHFRLDADRLYRRQVRQGQASAAQRGGTPRSLRESVAQLSGRRAYSMRGGLRSLPSVALKDFERRSTVHGSSPIRIRSGAK